MNYIYGVAGSINHLASNMDDSNGYLAFLEESYAITENLISMVHGIGMSAEGLTDDLVAALRARQVKCDEGRQIWIYFIYLKMAFVF